MSKKINKPPRCVKCHGKAGYRINGVWYCKGHYKEILK